MTLIRAKQAVWIGCNVQPFETRHARPLLVLRSVLGADHLPRRWQRATTADTVGLWKPAAAACCRTCRKHYRLGESLA